MALKFKKQYESSTIALADGMLVDKNNVSKPSVQERLKALPSLAYMLEEAAGEETPKQPVTGGGGAGDPRPKKAATRKK